MRIFHVYNDSPHENQCIKSVIQAVYNHTSFIFGKNYNDFKFKMNWVEPNGLIIDFSLKSGDTESIIFAAVKKWKVPIIILLDEEILNQDQLPDYLQLADQIILKSNLKDIDKAFEVFHYLDGQSHTDISYKDNLLLTAYTHLQGIKDLIDVKNENSSKIHKSLDELEQIIQELH